MQTKAEIKEQIRGLYLNDIVRVIPELDSQYKIVPIDQEFALVLQHEVTDIAVLCWSAPKTTGTSGKIYFCINASDGYLEFIRQVVCMCCIRGDNSDVKKRHIETICLNHGVDKLVMRYACYWPEDSRVKALEVTDSYTLAELNFALDGEDNT